MVSVAFGAVRPLQLDEYETDSEDDIFVKEDKNMLDISKF